MDTPPPPPGFTLDAPDKPPPGFTLDAPTAKPEAPSFLSEVRARAGKFAKSLANPITLGDVGQSFVDLGKTVAGANDAVAQRIVHPVETFRGSLAARALNVSTPEAVARHDAETREVLRGVNSNIPLANLAVQHMGGPAETSPEDAAAAPGAQSVGALAGAPIAGMEGAIAARGVGAAARGVGRALGRGVEAAEGRGVTRTLEKLEERTNKKAKAGVKTDAVENLVRDEPEIRKAAGNDEKLAKKLDSVRESAGAELGHIYSSAAPEVDLAVPIMKMDARIAEFAKGTSEDAEIGRQLQTIRDEMNDRIGSRDAVSPRELRDEQSAYQKKGYGKALPGDDAGTARIAANREASKAVGDAVLEHVTGMDYSAAVKAAEADPKSLVAKLLKANERINAANKIEAGIRDRAGKAQPAPGPLAMLKRIGAHAAVPVLAGAHGGPGMAIGAAVAQEALHAAPGAIRGGVAALDRGIAGGARAAAGAADVLAKLVERADAGDLLARRKLAAVSQAPIVAARVSAIRRKLASEATP